MIDVNNSKLLASGEKYRKELLVAPILKIDDLYGKYLTKRVGVRGSETVGALSSGAQVKPYTTKHEAADTSQIEMRTLTTYLGDVVEEFDPYQLSKTVYGDSVGKDIKNFDIVKAVALAVAGSVGDSLAGCLFSAKRKSDGKDTSDLFDGFYTIIAKEIAEGGLSAAKGNHVETDAITIDNVIDSLKGLYLKSSLKLRRKKHTLMFVPQNVLDLYNQAILNEVGPMSYNNSYEQTFLIGSNGRCELVPVYDEVENAPIILTTKGNMLQGCDQMSDEERVAIRAVDNPKLVQFFMILYFGVEFESVASHAMCVSTVKSV